MKPNLFEAYHSMNRVTGTLRRSAPASADHIDDEHD
jgi:hypothetical protein